MKKKLNKIIKLLLVFVMIFSQLSNVTKVLADEIGDNTENQTEDVGENENTDNETEDEEEETTEEEPEEEESDEDTLISLLEEAFTINGENIIFNAKDLKENDEHVVISTKYLYNAVADVTILTINDEPVDVSAEEVLLKNGDVIRLTTEDESVDISYTVIVMGDITDDSTFKDEDITNTMERYLEDEEIPSMDLYIEEDKPFGTITFEDIIELNGYRDKQESLTTEETNLELELNLDKKEYYTEEEFEVNIIVKAPVSDNESVDEEVITDEEEEPTPVEDVEEEISTETDIEEEATEEITDYINGIMGSIELSDNLELVNIEFNEKLLSAIKDNDFVAVGNKLNAEDIVITLTIKAVSEGTDSEIKITGNIAKELGISEYELSDKVNVTKKYSSNNYLKDLGATTGNFDTIFDKENNVYTLNVPADTEEVTLVGTVDDLYASVTGLTTYKLLTDKTVAKIVVTAEDGSTRNYFVYIVREAKTQPVAYYYSTNNYLKSLEIKGYEIEFDKNNFEYKIDVTNVSSLDITAIAEDSKARVIITGNEKFKEGENVVTISVTAENGQTKDYKIIVNKTLSTGLDEYDDESNTTEKIIIIILIILVVLGLLYLIFKKDEEEVQPVNNSNKKTETPDKKVNNNKKTNTKTNNNANNKKTTNNKVKKGR